jgi:hypothetical protein
VAFGYFAVAVVVTIAENAVDPHGTFTTVVVAGAVIFTDFESHVTV